MHRLQEVVPARKHPPLTPFRTQSSCRLLLAHPSDTHRKGVFLGEKEWRNLLAYLERTVVAPTPESKVLKTEMIRGDVLLLMKEISDQTGFKLSNDELAMDKNEAGVFPGVKRWSGK